MAQAEPHSPKRASHDLDVEVPDRPALAPNVQLVGELTETGFEDPQWLIERDGRFVQLTEPLYRVAEYADGERTPQEIATRVTESTQWRLSAEDVRRLIQAKLLPTGIILSADGSQASRHEDRTQQSPLALNIRAKAIGPRVIDPIAKVLQVFYNPAVLIPLLMAIAAAHVWLYFAHGLSASIRELVYEPASLVVVVVLMLASGVFHELGHASALRYGGGKARSMGVGIYLIYPVFYTDTTDGYRLGRWDRVRTDLGGFYFHLMFALGVVGLYLLSGHEFLLFIVFLIDLDIVRQCLPFVRFDGYWALADLTGVPDLFSQVGPFLRSVLPIKSREGGRSPRLKPWVEGVLTAYIILAIPTLLFFAFLLARNLPEVMSHMWASFLDHSAQLSKAQDSGDLAGSAAALSQMLLLGLEMLAIVVGLANLAYRLGRGLIGKIWKPSSATN